MQQISQVRKRTPGKLAKTSYPNEIVDYLETMRPLINTGQQGDSGSPRVLVSVKVSSIVSSQIGRYNGKKIIYGLNPNATGNLTEANLGTLPAADDVIIWHVPEIALASAKHMLKTGVVYEGVIAGIASDNKLIVRIGVLPIGETASPTTIGAASEGSEAADTTSWARSSGTPVDLWLHGRQAYYHAGDEKWYAYARKLSWDACGLFLGVTGETRFEVDAPEDC